MSAYIITRLLYIVRTLALMWVDGLRAHTVGHRSSLLLCTVDVVSHCTESASHYHKSSICV